MGAPKHDGPITFEVFTIFPGVIQAFLQAGLIAKAQARELVVVHCTDYRAHSSDRHHNVDDSPFGGGAGMVIKPEPVVAALEAVTAERGPMHRILLTPSGPRFDQRAAERLAALPRIALLCGRYEGIDDRVREGWVDECLSIGDFVLNGGEVAAAVIIEAVGRLREGVLGNPDSVAHESFSAGDDDAPADADADADWAWRPGLVLEHPHYTRPALFRGREVPAVLLAGDHAKVLAWRRRAACLRTWALRPELRPPWRLAADHPITLAAPAVLEPEQRLELATLAASAGWSCSFVGRGPSSMRDLKQLRRALRKRHGAEPWVLGVATCEDPERPRGPRLVLDVMAYERLEPPGPVLLWLGGADDPQAAGPQGPDAWLALSEDVRSNREDRLALAAALIDISQPPVTRSSPVSLAQLALAAFWAQGLLPAPVGGAP